MSKTSDADREVWDIVEDAQVEWYMRQLEEEKQVQKLKKSGLPATSSFSLDEKKSGLPSSSSFSSSPAQRC